MTEIRNQSWRDYIRKYLLTRDNVKREGGEATSKLQKTTRRSQKTSNIKKKHTV